MNVLILVPVFLFSLCLHEFAHAWVATCLGDPTAKKLGRLSIHPMAHADMLGTLILPSICIYYGLPFFGWAKPVPIDARYFKHARWGMAMVAAAGPAANLILAATATAVLAVAVRVDFSTLVGGGFDVGEAIQILSLLGIQVNLFLALFNLLPLPPLDGFMILQAVLPLKWVTILYRVTPYSGLILLVLLLTGGLKYLAMPVTGIYRQLLVLIS